jgi:anaerobic selenocysteine-containing dehydrogenase
MMTIGPTPGVDPESFVHSKYILLWACNTLGTNSHHWPFIEQARKAGARLVVIDPVRTRTARLADWHIPIRPGTDAALALAMIHVIIKENLVDRDYIDKHTVGYDELAERASTYTPEFAAQETGIPVDDIVKLAREFATTPPARGAHRCGRGAACRRGPDRACDRLPPRIDRRMEACRRRPASASYLGIPR